MFGIYYAYSHLYPPVETRLPIQQSQICLRCESVRLSVSLACNIESNVFTYRPSSVYAETFLYFASAHFCITSFRLNADDADILFFVVSDRLVPVLISDHNLRRLSEGTNPVSPSPPAVALYPYSLSVVCHFAIRATSLSLASSSHKWSNKTICQNPSHPYLLIAALKYGFCAYPFP